MKPPILSSLGLAVLACVSFVTPALAVVDIAYVPVGNAGNAADTADGDFGTSGVQRYGAVSYAYQIAKNETTISQYAEFLNAVAKTDSYALYNASMTTSNINGISQSGVSGSFTYSVNPGSENKPVTYVSWFDAARFCNWLQNGQQTGAGAALTAESGAYTLNGAVSGVSVNKNVGATIWIPSEDEWYKAAYYDPTKGGTGGYWLYPTRSDALSGNTIGVPNSANYWDGDYVGSGTSTRPTGMALTDVGAYGENSSSYFGTNDQGGNVWEWNDAVISGSARGLRGGRWDFNGTAGWYLKSSGRNSDNPSSEGAGLGFRVASVPEPTSGVLAMFASGMLLIRRKRAC